MTKAVEKTRPYTNEELERLKRDIRRGQAHASISMLFATIEADREKLEAASYEVTDLQKRVDLLTKRVEAAEARVSELEKAVEEAFIEMRHAEVFVNSRERIKRPEGSDQYRACLNKLERLSTLPVKGER